MLVLYRTARAGSAKQVARTGSLPWPLRHHLLPEPLQSRDRRSTSDGFKQIAGQATGHANLIDVQ